MGEFMKRKQVYLTPEIDSALKRIARGSRRTESDLIRKAVAQYVARYDRDEDLGKR